MFIIIRDRTILNFININNYLLKQPCVTICTKHIGSYKRYYLQYLTLIMNIVLICYGGDTGVQHASF